MVNSSGDMSFQINPFNLKSLLILINYREERKEIELVCKLLYQFSDGISAIKSLLSKVLNLLQNS
jgi:hypothetical protein